MVWDTRPPEPEELTDLDKKLIGPPRIITIPLEDPALLRTIGDMLCALGRDIQFNARRDNVSRREVALIVHHRIRELNERIRNLAEESGISMPRRGRRPNNSQGYTANESETNSLVSVVK